MSGRNSKLHFVDRLPQPKRLGSQTLLIHDRKLSTLVPGFQAWAKQFSATYAVTSGESLKDIREFPDHVEKILRLTKDLSARELCIVVAGGGSVGDFGGFVASVLKRGVKLIQIPTTWLAAIDSSHGGKTALNAVGSKNQIGTFYPAMDVYLVRSVLLAQPEARAKDAFGELAKIALIDGGGWIKNLRPSLKPNDLLWKNLKAAIEAKLKVVRRDPFEKSGVRQVLNFGHTLGHVLETELKLSHGEAVAQGLFFSLAWSFRRGDISLKEYGRARELLEDTFDIHPLNSKPQLTKAALKNGLLKDKKREAADALTFVFLKKFGRPIREKVTVDEILFEAKEQGWLR